MAIIMTNEELLTTLPAYVAGTLAPDKKRELEEYLDQRPNLRQYLASLNIHVAHFDQQLAEESTVTESYRARYGAPSNYSNHNDAAGVQAVGAIVKLLELPQEPSPPAERSILSPSGWKYATVASTIAFVVVCIAAGQFLLSMRQLASELNMTQQQVSMLESQNNQPGRAAQSESNAIPISPINLAQNASSSVSPPEASPGQQKLEFLPIESGTIGQAYFLVDAERSLLVLAGLQPLSDGQVYQLWFTNALGDTTFVAPLPLAANGPTLIDIYLPMNIYEYTAIGISSASIAEITQIGVPFFHVSPVAP